MDNPFISGMASRLTNRSDPPSDDLDSDAAPSIVDFDPDEYFGSDDYLTSDDDDSDAETARPKKKIRVTWRYTVLPEDDRERGREADQEVRDERKGFDPNTPCELCRLVDETAEVYPKSLQEFYEYEAVQSKRVPPERLQKLLKVKFNDLCYALDQETGGKANVKKMTVSGIREHRNHTIHLPHNAINLITEQIGYLRRSLNYIRFSQMWDERRVDGIPSGPVRVHSGGVMNYARMWKLLKEAIELREKLLANAERGGGGAGAGVKSFGFKKKASFSYLSFKPC